MQEPRSFIVRLYRFEPDAIAGVVEDVKHGYSLSFHSMAELWTVLTSDPPLKKARRHPTDDDSTI